MLKPPRLIIQIFYNNSIFLLVVAILSITFSGGCSSIETYSYFSRVQESLDVKKVGVLPFMNESGRRGAGEIVTNIFIAMIFKDGIFQVEERGNIEKFLIRNKLKALKKVDMKQLKKLGERLNLDAVFIGTVEEFSGGDQGRSLRTPAVSIRIRLVNVKTGKILWMVHHRKTGDDYIKVFEIGKIRSVSSLTKIVLSETIDSII